MEFFFEKGGEQPACYVPEKMKLNTIILRQSTLLSGSTLVTSETVYDDDRASGYLEIIIEEPEYYYDN